jgi:superoxide reductase
MEKREEKIYVCQKCGNEVKFVKDGGGTLICCGDPMSEKE